MTTPIKCNHPETLALTAGDAKWASNRLKYWQEIVYPGVDPARIARNYEAALASIMAVCNVQLEPANSPAEAQILAAAGPIDGPWNVLALTELPPVPDYQGVLHQTFDVAEVLDDDTMVAMMAHEACHFLGLGHDVTGTLMAPYLDPSIRTPQPRDIAQLQERYGVPLSAQGELHKYKLAIEGVGTLEIGIQSSVPCQLALHVLDYTPADVAAAK